MSNESLDDDEKVASETVTPQPAPDRRRLLRKLATLAGLGITGALLSQTKTGLLPTVGAFAMAGDIGFADGSGGTSYSDYFQYINPPGFLSVANVEWSEAPILASSRSGNVVGAALTLDSTNATAGNKYSIISTGSDAGPGGGFLGIWNDTAEFYPFVIGPTGNVGIGTISPSRLLEVLGNTVAPGTGLAENLRVTSNTAETGIGINNTSAEGHLWLITSTGTQAIEGTGQLGFYDNTAGAWRMNISNSGNVGIGTTTPKTTLQVNGGVSVAVKTVTSAYTMTTSDFTILANASSSALKVTLPPASNAGMLVFIKKIDASTHAVTISRAGTDTIEGATTLSLTAKNHSQALIAGGSGVWYILSTAT